MKEGKKIKEGRKRREEDERRREKGKEILIPMMGKISKNSHLLSRLNSLRKDLRTLRKLAPPSLSINS